MKVTVVNPQKVMPETIDVEYTDENTTWFYDYKSEKDVHRITDINGCLLIKRASYDYPVLIPGKTRADVNNSSSKARKLLEDLEESLLYWND